MADFPRRADRFREWSKLMLEQAVVPERPQYKTNSHGPGAVAPRMAPRAGRKFRRRRRKGNKRRKRNG